MSIFEFKNDKSGLKILRIGNLVCSTVDVDINRGNETLKLTVNTYDPVEISYTDRTQENGKWWDCVKNPYSVSSYSKDQSLRDFILRSVKHGRIPTLDDHWTKKGKHCEHGKHGGRCAHCEHCEHCKC